MRITVENYHPEDFTSLQKMTKNSFLLNAFNVDSHLPHLLKGELYFETMARKAMQEHSNSCLVARLNDDAVGYLIYGIDRSLTDAFGFVTGAIILFCVREDIQGKKVGKALLDQTLRYLKKSGVRLVSVGTDGNNIAALNLYQNFGFRTRLNWGTFRLYPNFPLPSPPKRTPAVTPFTGEKGIERLTRYTERPIAFFREKKIHPRNMVKFRKTIAATVRKGIISGKYGTLLIKEKGLLKERISAFLTYEQEPNVEQFFNKGTMKKRVFRVNDIVTHPGSRNKGLGTALLDTFVRSAGENHFIEIWIAMDNWPMLNVAAQCGFRLAHLATVLHCFIS